ncbi:MAG: LLM class flavin-dependent oxidoreductase [Dehalococcoidia bacterium]
MIFRPQRMKFGIFLAPFHRVGENPTLALKRDLKLIELLDELGFDEAWIGEHHSFARELIADPFAFAAAAAMRTRRIRLGTGVTSLPYHHPLIVADHAVMLDHLTEGRFMLGCGPGALTPDAVMMGIDPLTQRIRMNESLEAVMTLLRTREPFSMETDWFTLKDAHLQLANYTFPHLPVAVAASITPSGPTAAGKHGIGLLSVAGVDSEALPRVWGWAEESAAAAGQAVDRNDWRVVVAIHLADTREKAFADVREGFSRQAYVGDRKTPGGPAGSPFVSGASSAEEAAEKGSMIVGTPDDAIAAIEEIARRAGGIGAILGLAHEWANSEATNHSYELLARYVAPHFQGQLETIIANRDYIEDRQMQVFGATGAAYLKAFQDAGKEIPKALLEAMAAAAAARPQQPAENP